MAFRVGGSRFEELCRGVQGFVANTFSAKIEKDSIIAIYQCLSKQFVKL